MWVALLMSMAAQCSGAACPNPCTACAFQPAEGTNPSLSSWRQRFVAAAERTIAGTDVPAIATVEVGADRSRLAPASVRTSR